jgi:hypothetical protein
MSRRSVFLVPSVLSLVVFLSNCGNHQLVSNIWRLVSNLYTRYKCYMLSYDSREPSSGAGWCNIQSVKAFTVLR